MRRSMSAAAVSTGVAPQIGGARIVVHHHHTFSTARRPARPGSGRKVKGWIIRCVILATGSVALLDLYLLLSGLNH
jgi:hypothetical protein